MDMGKIVFMAEEAERKRMGYDPYYDKPDAPKVDDPYHRREREDRPMRPENRRRDGRGRYMTYMGDHDNSRKIGFDQGGSQGRERKGRNQLTMEQAEEWVDMMENESDEYPNGGRWEVDEVEEIAEEYGIKPDTPKFAEFYAVMNMMFSDYGEIIEKFDLDEEDFCACMAMAWIKDRDAARGKTARYYNAVVKGGKERY